MKYIMLRRGEQEVPVIFPEFLNHADVARVMTGVFELSTAKPVSAGTVEVMALATHGKSVTLGDLPARDEDAATINCFDYLQGLVGMPNVSQTERLVLTAVLLALADRLEPDGHPA